MNESITRLEFFLLFLNERDTDNFKELDVEDWC